MPSLSLAQFAEQLKNFRGPIADDKGRMTSEFKQFFYGVVTQSEDIVSDAQAAADTAQTAASSAQTAADTAQTSATAAATAATNAAQSSGYLEFPDGRNITWTDAGLGFPAGNPTKDFTVTGRTNAGTQIATMVVRGTLTTASGAITLAVQSESVTATYAIDEVFSGSGTQTTAATITVTFPDGSQLVGALSWRSVDITIGGELVSY